MFDSPPSVRPLPHDRQRQLAKGRDWPTYRPPYPTGVRGGGQKPPWRLPPAARNLGVVAQISMRVGTAGRQHRKTSSVAARPGPAQHPDPAQPSHWIMLDSSGFRGIMLPRQSAGVRAAAAADGRSFLKAAHAADWVAVVWQVSFLEVFSHCKPYAGAQPVWCLPLPVVWQAPEMSASS